MLLPTYAGMVALNAMNEHGVALCVNTLPDLSTSATGLPVACVIRRVMKAKDYDQAVAALVGTPHASGQNYLVGTPEVVSNFECSAASVAEHAQGDRIVHTNHSLTSPSGRSGVGAPQTGPLSNSKMRLGFLEARVVAPGPVTVGRTSTWLAEKPLCRGSDGDDGFTLYSVVMVPATRTLWISGGSPDAFEYCEFHVG